MRLSPILTTPVPGATIGTVIAAYGLGWQQSSLGLWPILWGVALSKESVVGGTSVVGTVTLLNPAPPGGVEVALVNNDSDLITLPQTILIPEGCDRRDVRHVVTAPVSVPTRVTIDSGTAFEGYHAPSTWLTLLPEEVQRHLESLGADARLREDSRRAHDHGDGDRPPEREHGGPGRHPGE